MKSWTSFLLLTSNYEFTFHDSAHSLHKTQLSSNESGLQLTTHTTEPVSFFYFTISGQETNG